MTARRFVFLLFFLISFCFVSSASAEIIFDGRPRGGVGTAAYNPPFGTMHSCRNANSCPGTVITDQLQIVNSPTRFANGKSWRVQVRNGWHFTGSTGERTELVNASFAGGVNPGAHSGQVRWYGSSWFFPAGFPNTLGYGNIWQFKSNDGGTPNVGIETVGDAIVLRLRGGTHNSTTARSGTFQRSYNNVWPSPLPKGVWLDLKWAVKWSVQNDGWIIIKRKISNVRTYTQTEVNERDTSSRWHPTRYNTGSTTWWNERTGLYRSAVNIATAVFYTSGYVVATSEEEIDEIFGAITDDPLPPPDPTGVVVAQTIQQGDTLRGVSVWRATVTGCRPTRVEFLLNETPILSETNAPFGDTVGFWNSTTAANGSHRFAVKATCPDGTAHLSPTATATVANVTTPPPPPPPPPPQTLEQQIAELAALLEQLRQRLEALEGLQNP